MSNGTTTDDIARVLTQGDLSKLSELQRAEYYATVCRQLGLNHLTQPFQYLWLGKGTEEKLVLYATKSCTEQLRANQHVSLQLVSSETLHGVYVVRCKATLPGGRCDEATGAVPIEREDGTWETNSSGKRFFKSNGKFIPLRGDALANAIMKSETKAKRRATLSICGLGMLDESEIESIPDARPITGKDPNLPAMAALPDKASTISSGTAEQLLDLFRRAKLDFFAPKSQENFRNLFGREIPHPSKMTEAEFAVVRERVEKKMASQQQAAPKSDAGSATNTTSV